MADEIRVNRQPSAGGQQPVRPEAPPMETAQPASKMPWVILAVIVVVIVLLGMAFRDKLFSGSTGSSKTQSSSYQAVFLTNGQVYFGKLADVKKEYVTLTDIYYLQVVQRQPLQGTPSTTTPAAAPGQDITLVKLGQELHGPVDEMHISRQQILFYEDLKKEGQVVSAILKDRADKAAAPAK